MADGEQQAQRSEVEKILEFLRVCTKLKTTKRTGWLQKGVAGAESISDHMHRMAIIAMLVAKHAPQRDRLVRMAVVHDLAEAIVGDITPHDGVSDEEKRSREDAAMRHFRDDLLNNSAAGREIYDLWREYDDGISEDAQIMKQIDKLEMILQAHEYEHEQQIDLSDFFNSTMRCFPSSPFSEWADRLRETRPQQPPPPPSQHLSASMHRGSAPNCGDN